MWLRCKERIDQVVITGYMWTTAMQKHGSNELG